MLDRIVFAFARLIVKAIGGQSIAEALAYESAGENGRVMVYVVDEEEDDDSDDDDGGEPVALDPIWDIWGSES